MVIEFLTFSVAPDDLDEWLAADAANWTRFLEQQDGFVRKEIWQHSDDPSTVHAVIWWQSTEQWQRIPTEELDRVTKAMGPIDRRAECVGFDVLRST